MGTQGTSAAGSGPGLGLTRLAQGTERDLRTLQVKMTYVGPQTKAVPTVAFTTFHHLLRMDWFHSLQTPGLSYENDAHVVWNFTVLPAEMLRIVTALSRLDAARQSCPIDQADLSLAVVLRDSRLGEIALEVILDASGAQAVNATIRDALDQDDGVGRSVLDLQRQII